VEHHNFLPFAVRVRDCFSLHLRCCFRPAKREIGLFRY
jgi:hypothetical protein